MELVIKTGTKYQKIKLKDRKKGRVLEEESRKKATIALVLIFSALWLVKKTCINTRPPSPPPPPKKKWKSYVNNQSWLVHPRFPHFRRFTCIYYDSLCYFSLPHFRNLKKDYRHACTCKWQWDTTDSFPTLTPPSMIEFTTTEERSTFGVTPWLFCNQEKKSKESRRGKQIGPCTIFSQ